MATWRFSPSIIRSAIRMGWVARHSPEAPGFFARLCVVGDEGPAHAIVRAVVSHEHFAFGHVRRSGDPGLSCIADGGFPHLGSGSGINRDEPAIAGAYVHF